MSHEKPFGMERFLPKNGELSFSEKDMTGMDFGNRKKKLERELREAEEARAAAINARNYERLKILNGEIARLKNELHR